MSASLATRPVDATTAPVRRAVRVMLPVAVAVIPFGTVVGVTMAQTDVATVPALAATALVYAGSAQLAAVSAVLAGSGVVGAVVAGLIVNARLVLYSATFGQRFRDGQPIWFRWLGPLTTVDQSFAVAAAAPDLEGAAFRRFWVTCGVLLGGLWLVAVGAGMALGDALTPDSPLQVAGPAILVALLVPHLRTARLRRVAIAASAVGTAALVVPSGVAIVLAIVAGLAAAGPTPEGAER